MQVVKRSGHSEPMKFDKITARIKALCKGLDKSISPVAVTQKVVEGLFDGVTTQQIDTLVAETAASMVSQHSDFALLAARVEISRLHKTTPESFSEATEILYGAKDLRGNPAPLVSEEYIQIVRENADVLNDLIDDERDFLLEYFGYKVLEESYLLRVDGKVVERPQYIFLRTAVGVHGRDIENVRKTYEYMSSKKYTHATPTLFNAGTPYPQLASCFLLTMDGDSLEGISSTLTKAMAISKYGGGIGINTHKIRSKGSLIRSSGRQADGLVPMLRLFNQAAVYVNQGGKRKGAFAFYLEPWHPDILDFLDLKKNHGKEEFKARDLFYGMWIPDLFMQRVKDDADWSLLDPDECPGLEDVCDEADSKAFTELYELYEREGRARKILRARDLFTAIVKAQIETGTPYMLYKDSVNRKSNQKNVGVIKGSNLCTEIVEYTSPDEIAVCNLASIALSTFVTGKSFDFSSLYDVAYHAAYSLDVVIDRTFYPVEEARYSNLKHRPIGIGVQGLADVFAMLGYDYDQAESRVLNRDIFETIYYAALRASCDLARIHGPYESYIGSPISQGILQFDMWGDKSSDRWDWETLREDIRKHGVRNSLLVAPMPTASTASILGNNEAFEPFTNNIYVRRILAGEFIMVNKHLVRDLSREGLWNDSMRRKIIAEGGSVQNISSIPEAIRRRYRTVWEIPQRSVIEMARDRAPFIDQTQSMNLHIASPTIGKLTSMHFAAWEAGLKTGSYYIRTQAAAKAIAFTVTKEDKELDAEAVACSIDNPDACVMCSS